MQLFPLRQWQVDVSGQDFACGSGDFSKFPSLMINLTLSRRKYSVPLLIWPCLNIRTCNLEMLVAPFHRCLTSVGVCVIFLAVNLLALSGIARASSWHNEYPERLIAVSKFSIDLNAFIWLSQSLPVAVPMVNRLFLLQYSHSPNRSG